MEDRYGNRYRRELGTFTFLPFYPDEGDETIITLSPPAISSGEVHSYPFCPTCYQALVVCTPPTNGRVTTREMPTWFAALLLLAALIAVFAARFAPK